MYAAVTAADGERAVLDDKQIVLGSDGVDAIHLNWQAEIVDDAYGAGAWRHGGCNLVRSDVTGRRIGIDKDTGASREFHRMRSRDVSLGRNNHLIAWPDTAIEISEMQCRCARRDAG